MSSDKQRKLSLSPEWSITEIFTINYTLEMKGEIYIDFLKADTNGSLLTDGRAAVDRWREYFEQASSDEFVYPPLPQSLPVFEAVPVSATEVEEAIKRIKSGKATGPDGIAPELWEAKSWNPTLWLSEFFNRII